MQYAQRRSWDRYGGRTSPDRRHAAHRGTGTRVGRGGRSAWRDPLPDAATLKARITPRDFYAHELPGLPAPKRDHGWADGGLCPFHDDRQRGSFRVNLTSGAYKCFSCDAHGGDIIAFIKQQYGLSFRDALEHLARTWGIRQ